MYITAHRGFDEYYPENTLSAVGDAARTDGVDAVEFDVRRCGSGELVVIHYDHVGAVSDSHGDVDALSASELASISVEGSGEGRPGTGRDARCHAAGDRSEHRAQGDPTGRGRA